IMTAEIEYATQPTIQVLGCRDMNSVQVEARIVQVGKKVRVTAKYLNLGRRLLGYCGDREEQNQGEQKTSLLHHQFPPIFRDGPTASHYIRRRCAGQREIPVRTSQVTGVPRQLLPVTPTNGPPPSSRGAACHSTVRPVEMPCVTAPDVPVSVSM